MLVRKGNIKRETESLLIAAQFNAVRTNHIEARIDKTQQNYRYILCGDRDETINHIINESSKFAQKEYNTRLGWVGRVIHWELCKKLTFDHIDKWYIYNPESVLENETHKLQWDFEIQTDNQISTRRRHLIIIKKRPCRKVDSTVSVNYRIKGKKTKRMTSILTLLEN